jgi:predicted Zn-dependent peptidase
MEAVRRQLLPGVALTCLQTDKFKTGCLSVNLLTQLCRENAAKNALIPMVLRRGTSRLPDMEAISAELDMLYGARIEPLVRKVGEVQVIGFYADFADDKFLPQGSKQLEGVSKLVGEMLLSPLTRGGLLLPAYVDGEREKLLDMIRGRINEKRGYSIHRLIELMCFGEDYAVSSVGGEDEAENIGYQKLTKHYHQLLATSPVECFYCGSAEPDYVAGVMRETLLNVPRGEIDYEIGTDIRMNTLEAETRYFTDEMDVTQGKLAIGWRLGECMEEPDVPAIRVFNAVYGGAVTSRLFENVREKLSLCYFADSMTDVQKGVMIVSSGVEFAKFDEAKDEIFRQLEAVKNGDVTDQELEYAGRYVASSLRTVSDSPGSLENFYLTQALGGWDWNPEELASLCEYVTKEQVVSVAQSCCCDAVYFLRGLPEGEEAEEE